MVYDQLLLLIATSIIIISFLVSCTTLTIPRIMYNYKLQYQLLICCLSWYLLLIIVNLLLIRQL